VTGDLRQIGKAGCRGVAIMEKGGAGVGEIKC
jgi:hypothetical protein